MSNPGSVIFNVSTVNDTLRIDGSNQINSNWGRKNRLSLRHRNTNRLDVDWSGHNLTRNTLTNMMKMARRLKDVTQSLDCSSQRSK